MGAGLRYCIIPPKDPFQKKRTDLFVKLTIPQKNRTTLLRQLGYDGAGNPAISVKLLILCEKNTTHEKPT